MLVQTLRYGLDPEGFFAAPHRRVGDLFTVRVLAETWVVVADPAAVKEVFALGPEEADSGAANFALRPLIGTRNVLLADGEEHLARRRLLLPPFHGERMRAYGRAISAATASLLASLPRGEPVALLPRAQELTFSVIMRCVFGLRGEEGVGRLGVELRKTLTWITDLRRALVFGLLGPERVMAMPSFRRQMRDLDRLLGAEIERRRAAPNLAAREDILSMLLTARDEQGSCLTDAELRDELLTLLVAGHETTAALIAWAAHELARAPGYQDRLAAGEEGLADAIVTETLRLHPPVPLVLRRLRRPATIAGHRLPAGTTLAPCALLVHRRPDLYPDPWRFRPERFLDHRPPASEWFPFGGSARRCLGAAFAQLEARTVLEALFAEVRLSSARSRPERVGRRGPILVPGRGARVIAVPRPNT